MLCAIKYTVTIPTMGEKDENVVICHLIHVDGAVKQWKRNGCNDDDDENKDSVNDLFY